MEKYFVDENGYTYMVKDESELGEYQDKDYSVTTVINYINENRNIEDYK